MAAAAAGCCNDTGLRWVISESVLAQQHWVELQCGEKLAGYGPCLPP